MILSAQWFLRGMCADLVSFKTSRGMCDNHVRTIILTGNVWCDDLVKAMISAGKLWWYVMMLSVLGHLGNVWWYVMILSVLGHLGKCVMICDDLVSFRTSRGMCDYHIRTIISTGNEWCDDLVRAMISAGNVRWSCQRNDLYGECDGNVCTRSYKYDFSVNLKYSVDNGTIASGK